MNVARRIYELKYFQGALNKIIKSSVINLFPVLENAPRQFQRNLFDKFEGEETDWGYLISVASVLAHSSDPECQDAALRISQCCLIDDQTNEIQKNASSVILNKLTNKPAISLAITKDYLKNNFNENVPFPIRIENFKRDLSHTIYAVDGKEIYLNRFQKEFYDKAKNVNHLSASAPTSSGKSFILNTIVFERIKLGVGPQCIVYIVPTRALINQVEFEFTKEITTRRIKDVNISSVPHLSSIRKENESTLFIFTQERLHWFLNENPNFKIDHLIVDEAQKINDGGRGILLQQKIEELTLKWPNLKVLFCSPFSKNPEELLEILPKNSSKESISSEYVAVNQNLILVSKNPRKLVWSISICLTEVSIHLGNITLEKSPKESEKLPLFAYKLGSSDGGNLIYVNGQAEAEDTANILYEMLGTWKSILMKNCMI